MKILLMILTLLFITETNAQNAALAIDQNNGDRYGWAVDYETQTDADKRALTECQRNGGNCNVVLRFTGGCGVYVVEQGNNSLYGWGTGNTKSEAETRARKEATAIGGKDLIVRVWGCNGNGNLVKSEEGQKMVKGVFYFYYTENSDIEKVAYVSDLMYQPGIATKSGTKWVMTNNSESILMPIAKQFYDYTDNAIYGWLGDLKDEAIKRTGYNWEGINEIKYNSEALDMNLNDRRERIEKGRQGLIKELKDEGYAINYVNLH